MPSSTSHHGSFSRGLLALLFAGIVGAPLLWLTALQTGYVLAYQECDTRSPLWVRGPTFGAVVLLACLAAVSWRSHARAREEPLPMPLLGWIAVGMSVLILIVMSVTSIAPVVLHPCD
jgi:hypothetical protein